MLAVEWAQHGIRVNAIAPGRMETASPSRAGTGADPKYMKAMLDRIPLPIASARQRRWRRRWLSRKPAGCFDHRAGFGARRWFDGGLRALSIEFRAVISVRSRARRCEAMTLPRRPRAGGDPYAASYELRYGRR